MSRTSRSSPVPSCVRRRRARPASLLRSARERRARTTGRRSRGRCRRRRGPPRRWPWPRESFEFQLPRHRRRRRPCRCPGWPRNGPRAAARPRPSRCGSLRARSAATRCSARRASAPGRNPRGPGRDRRWADLWAPSRPRSGRRSANRRACPTSTGRAQAARGIRLRGSGRRSPGAARSPHAGAPRPA